MKKEKRKKRGSLAIFEIILLVVSTIAISHFLGIGLDDEFPLVGAQGELCINYNGQVTRVGAEGSSELYGWCIDNDPNREICDPVRTGSNKGYLRSGINRIPCQSQTEQSQGPSTTPTTVFTESIQRRGAEILFGQVDLFPDDNERDDETTDDDDDADGNETATGLSAILGTAIGETTIGSILQNAAIAIGIYFGVRFVLNQFGASPELAGALAEGAAAGYAAATIGVPLLEGILSTSIGGLATAGIGVAVGIVVAVVSYTETRYDLYSFSCYPWEAPTGGEFCEECNQGDIPCTEYRCRSLGQACELVNQGTSEELCVWRDRDDVNPPVIQPWEDVLTIDYRYVPDNAVSPPDRGWEITPEDDANGCVAPFTPITFGVELDEPGRCKLTPVNARSFEEMPNNYFNGSSTLKYNHSQSVSIPSPSSLEAQNVTLINNGEFTLYSRCEDANGNSNVGNFVLKFCVDDGPDTTPPVIVTTSILNGAPIAFNQTSVDLQVYVNEPSECRWSKLDKSYDDMEHEMTCETNALEFNAQMLYQCETTLTGLVDRQDNNFYFRCKDQPHLEGTAEENQRNVNQESYLFTLIGTRPLVIDSVEPNGTIKDSTDVIRIDLKAETSAGFNEGEAICSFSSTGVEGSYTEFFNTGTHEHSSRLDLPEGDYTYHIRCVDLGGNSDSAIARFRVESDNTAPIVVRAFHEENDLKIITNENASCVYDNIDCSYLFEDGISMSTQDDITHQVTWNPNRNFYIKCEDDFGNRPNPNACSIIVRPFEV